MKKQFLRRIVAYLLMSTIICLFFTSCIRQQINPEIPKQNSRTEQAATDLEGAASYEFNLIKNPYSGTIPAGSFTNSLLQAKALNNEQERNNIISANVYTYQGPDNLGGRTRAVKYDRRFNGTTNRIILAGGVSGCMFKSIDNGATWVRKNPSGDLFNITCLVQDRRPGFEDIWYYAGGEAIGNSSSGPGASYRGKGVFKSIDNGDSWTYLPASNTGVLESFDDFADYTFNLAAHPATGHIYLACLDAIKRSTDGGLTWSTVLTSGAGALSASFATDIIITPSGRFYASFSGLCPTGPTSTPGVWTSMTGALGSWTKIAGSGAGTTPAGWNADGAYGRVVLAYAPSMDSKVFALYYNLYSSTCGAPAPEAEFFSWDDGMSIWTDLSANLPDEPGCKEGNDPFACQTGYDLVVAVKPDDPSTVFIGGTNIYRSTSGFTTTAATTRIGGYEFPTSYDLYPGSHPDIHAIAFSPVSTTTMLCGNDGGIQRTTDNLAPTVVWSSLSSGFNTYQYYYVDVDPRIGNGKVMGGAQDNGTSRNIGGFGSSFEGIFGGDGVSVGLSEPAGVGTQYEYLGYQLGNIFRKDALFPPGTGTDLTPPGKSGSGLFVTLFHLDPDNTENLYYANANELFRTASASSVTSGSWVFMIAVSAMVAMPNSITAFATTRGVYSPATASLFMGTSHGKVLRLDHPAGATPPSAPVDITGAAFPSGYVSSISVNPRNDDTVLVTFSSYGVTSAFWTGSANSPVPAWTAVEGGLTLPSYRSSAIAISATGVDYFVGTSVGLYTSTGLPGVVSWVKEGPTDVDNAPVVDLALRKSDNRLLVGTHGYGMWVTSLTLPIVPLTLTEFKGTLNNKDVLLSWKTATEANSSHFELEKSFDGIGYRRLAAIPAGGFSNTEKQYQFIDREPLSERNYYRLRSVDKDGKFTLSNVVLIKPALLTQDMIIGGNPFNDDIYVRFANAATSSGELQLTDMSGRVVTRQTVNQGTLQIQIMLPPARLSKGVYWLTAAFSDGYLITKQVIKY